MTDTVKMLVDALQAIAKHKAPEHRFADIEDLAFVQSIASHALTLAAASNGGWLPIESAPKDGAEFVATYGHEGFVMQLVKFDTVHKLWKSKGALVPGFETNATHWQQLPQPPKDTP